MKRIAIGLFFALQVAGLSAYAANKNPILDCTLSDTATGDQIGAPKDTFTKDTAKIFLYCDSNDVKKGQILKSVWVAVNTHNVAPANYKIDSVSYTVPKDAPAGQTFTAEFSLSKPTKGWPKGNYLVNVYADGKLNKTVKFNVN